MNTWTKLIIATGSTFATGWIGKLIMGDTAQSAWYLSLNKPPFNPPSWVFGVIWPALYLLMGLAAWQVWQKERAFFDNPGLPLFFIHLTLNPLWIYLFFDQQAILFGLICLLIITSLAWIIALQFKETQQLAFYLFLPYPLWLSFATLLNASIYALN